MFERLDFANYQSGNVAKRDQFCRKLVSGLRQRGFVRLVNHGIEPSTIDKAFATSRHFFQLPLNQKLKSPHPPTANPHRGFSAVGLENVSTISNYGREDKSSQLPLLKDMKESYDIGSERDELYSNIWPPTGVCDTFEPTFVEFFEVCYRTQLLILEAISIGLGLPTQTLSQLHAAQHNELRLTHYPAVPQEAFSTSTRIAAHTDFGSITLLFQDRVGGLEVESPPGSGSFVGIASGGPYECILNAGDCLQKWTGLCSARHRVHLPELPQGNEQARKGDVVEERFSIAYFAKPDRTAVLRPLLDGSGLGAKVSSEFVTAGEFQHMRIQGTYA
ncbi:MAG: hypothetical protein Q9157_000799 [Trypethelium eluteriae]